jgi:hypothetical protein
MGKSQYTFGNHKFASFLKNIVRNHKFNALHNNSTKIELITKLVTYTFCFRCPTNSDFLKKYCFMVEENVTSFRERKFNHHHHHHHTYHPFQNLILKRRWQGEVGEELHLRHFLTARGMFHWHHWNHSLCLQR